MQAYGENIPSRLVTSQQYIQYIVYIRNILSISIIFAGGQNVPSYFFYDKGCALLQHVAAGDNIPGRNEVLGVD